jgi:hypothetical protein
MFQGARIIWLHQTTKLAGLDPWTVGTNASTLIPGSRAVLMVNDQRFLTEYFFCGRNENTYAINVVPTRNSAWRFFFEFVVMLSANHKTSFLKHILFCF